MANLSKELREQGGFGFGLDLNPRVRGRHLENILSGNAGADGEQIARNGQIAEVTDASVAANLATYLDGRDADGVNSLMAAVSEANDLSGAETGAFYYASLMSAINREIDIPAQLQGDDAASMYARRIVGALGEVDNRRQERVEGFLNDPTRDGARIGRIGEYFSERVQAVPEEQRLAEIDRILNEINSDDLPRSLKDKITAEVYDAAVQHLSNIELSELSASADLSVSATNDIRVELSRRLAESSANGTELDAGQIAMTEALLATAYRVTDNGPAEQGTIVLDGVLSAEELSLISQIGQEIKDGRVERFNATDVFTPWDEDHTFDRAEDVNLADGVDPGEAGRIVAAAAKAQIER